jgi:peptidyl-prolyl cis-trans isomerase A (cyclophilin A)
MKHFTVILIFCAAGLIGCSSSNSGKSEGTQEAKKSESKPAPDVFKVKLDTSKGEVVIEVHRDWAPRGADRFYALVQDKFFDEARFFRVLPGFVAQFGLAKDPKVTAAWNQAIPDDPVKQTNTRGTVTFATAGPNTRTTQLFINTGENGGSLDSQGFSPFGKVIEGMSVVDHLYSGYGEGSPQGQGPDQARITAEGNEYLTSKFGELDYIKTARVE